MAERVEKEECGCFLAQEADEDHGLALVQCLCGRAIRADGGTRVPGILMEGLGLL